MDTSIVVETYNYLEGASIDALRAALRAATKVIAPEGEVLVADVSGDSAVRQMLSAEFPDVRRVDAVGLGYDEAKMRAAEGAKSRYVVFLDGDCLPESAWFENLMAPLRQGVAVATGGFARYPPSFFSAILSVMDFGFLLPRIERKLGCYAFNNAAFLRDALLQIPLPQGPMRCRCYAHAQRLSRAGMPVLLTPSAAVVHGRPPFIRERLRQGYDVIAACWVDPDLPEARWLCWGPAAAPIYYLRAIRLDWHRYQAGFKDLGLKRWQAVIAFPLFPILRLVDFVGIMGALLFRVRSRRWLDWGSQHLRS